MIKIEPLTPSVLGRQPEMKRYSWNSSARKSVCTDGKTLAYFSAKSTKELQPRVSVNSLMSSRLAIGPL